MAGDLNCHNKPSIKIFAYYTIRSAQGSRNSSVFMLTHIAIFLIDPQLQACADQLAQQLGLPIVLQPEASYDYLLKLAPDGISLIKTTDSTSPLFVNFLSKKMRYR